MNALPQGSQVHGSTSLPPKPQIRNLLYTHGRPLSIDTRQKVETKTRFAHEVHHDRSLVLFIFICDREAGLPDIRDLFLSSAKNLCFAAVSVRVQAVHIFAVI